MAISKAQRNAEAKRNSAVVAAAYANPDTRCVSCGMTLEECGPRRDGRNANGSPITWDAGHPDGRWPGDDRRPECSHCNRSHGAAKGNRQRSSGYSWP